MSDTSVAVIVRLILEGQTRTSNVANILRDATVERTIDGANTLTLELYDNARTLLRSGILSTRTTCTIDGSTFELVQVRKSLNNLTLVFEDLAVAAMRRRNSAIKVSANTITHIEFAERMVKEESWIELWVPEELRNAEKAKVELARGKPDTADAELEDTWTALGRIADERGWRRFMKDRDTVAYVTEEYLLKQTPTYTLTERSPGVEQLDFDFDSGKPVAQLTATFRAGRWELPIGTVVRVSELGPADGDWLVSSVSRSLFSLFVTVMLTKARPVLPEPEATEVAEEAGGTTNTGTAATAAVVSDSGTYPSDPDDLVKIGQGTHRLIPAAAASFARVQGIFGMKFSVTDSYRSTASQAASYAKDPSRFAKPGNSAHGEGRAVDVNLGHVGVSGLSSDPKKWDDNPTWQRLNQAFMQEGWCNYQYHQGTTKGRTSEPWHWAYRVCK